MAVKNSDTVRLILHRLFAARRVLLMTHRRPDGDALGSTFGMRSFLRENQITADVLMPDGMPDRYRRLCSGAVTTACEEDYDLFLSLDCANPDRLGTVDNLPLEKLRLLNFISVDHHRGNSIAAPLEWTVPEAASTCQLVSELLLASKQPFSSECATLLMTGMMTDSGRFCFANTTAKCFRVAAELMEHGADVERIANEVFFSKTLSQLQFESELIATQLRIVCDGKFAYAFVPDELMAKHSFSMREDEGLIDILRGLDGVVIAMLVHHRDDGFRISLRSKDGSRPVGPLARELGGGGHEMAAGTTLDLPDFAAVEALMIPRIAALLA